MQENPSLPPLPRAAGPIRRIVFMGSPAFALPSLNALHNAGYEIVAVYTQPPRPAGRGLKLTPTPVHQRATELGLPVHHPEKLKEQALEDVLALNPDVYVVVGYGLLLPRAIVETKLCLNVHPSALPRWRGPTPVQSAIRAGDTITEVCIMQLEAGMDTGPVFSRTPVAITPHMTTGELNDIVWAHGATRLLNVLAKLPNLTPIPQHGEASRSYKILPEHRPLNLNHTAAHLHNHIRALAPSPGATLSHPEIAGGETLKIGGSTLPELVPPTQRPTSPITKPTLHGGILWLSVGGGTTLGLTHAQRPGKPMQPIDKILS